MKKKITRKTSQNQSTGRRLHQKRKKKQKISWSRQCLMMGACLDLICWVTMGMHQTIRIELHLPLISHLFLWSRNMQLSFIYLYFQVQLHLSLYRSRKHFVVPLLYVTQNFQRVSQKNFHVRKNSWIQKWRGNFCCFTKTKLFCKRRNMDFLNPHFDVINTYIYQI